MFGGVGMAANGCVQVCADGTRSHQEYIKDTSTQPRVPALITASSKMMQQHGHCNNNNTVL